MEPLIQLDEIPSNCDEIVVMKLREIVGVASLYKIILIVVGPELRLGFVEKSSEWQCPEHN